MNVLDFAAVALGSVITIMFFLTKVEIPTQEHVKIKVKK